MRLSTRLLKQSCGSACIALILLNAISISARENRAPFDEQSRALKPVVLGGAILNVMDFGAVGDGVADDGPAFQSALEALADAGGGTLFVPAGRYLIATPVVKDFSYLQRWHSNDSRRGVGHHAGAADRLRRSTGGKFGSGLGNISRYWSNR